MYDSPRRRRGALGQRPRSAVAITVAALFAGLLTGAAAPAQAATVDTTSWYVLVNRNSGKALDVSAASTNNGAAVQQWTRHNGDNQQFQFMDSGGGYYRLRARHSGKALDVSGFSTADSAFVQQWSDIYGSNQQFRLADAANGDVKLVNRNSGKVVEVQNASTADGARVVQYADLGRANQQWQLVRVGAIGSLPSTFRWSS